MNSSTFNLAITVTYLEWSFVQHCSYCIFLFLKGWNAIYCYTAQLQCIDLLPSIMEIKILCVIYILNSPFGSISELNRQNSLLAHALGRSTLAFECKKSNLKRHIHQKIVLGYELQKLAGNLSLTIWIYTIFSQGSGVTYLNDSYLYCTFFIQVY